MHLLTIARFSALLIGESRRADFVNRKLMISVRENQLRFEAFRGLKSFFRGIIGHIDTRKSIFNLQNISCGENSNRMAEN